MGYIENGRIAYGQLTGPAIDWEEFRNHFVAVDSVWMWNEIKEKKTHVRNSFIFI